MSDKVIRTTIDYSQVDAALKDLNQVIIDNDEAITQPDADKLVDLLVDELTFTGVTDNKVVIKVSEGHYERVNALRRLDT